MTISMYIHTNENLKKLDFITAYTTITELIRDNRLVWDFEREKDTKENV